MVVSFEEAAKMLHMEKKKLVEEGLKAYSRERLRELTKAILLTTSQGLTIWRAKKRK